MNSRQHYLEGFLAGTGRPAPAVPVAVAAASEPAPTAVSWEEQVKRELPPLDAFPRLLACARTDEPPSDADRFRFRWFGLFYQGPEQDAFTARLRLPGGRLPRFQLRALAGIAQELAGGYVELNSQGGLDLPGIPVRASVELLRRVEEIGLRTRGTGGDCVQAVRGRAREDLAAIHELEQVFAHGREFGDLPAGCEVVFGPLPEPAGEAAVVFRSTGPEQRQVILPGSGDLGISVAPAETVPVCLALLRVWSHRADRENREAATLKNFCLGLGAETLRDALAEELDGKLTLFSSPPAAPGELDASPGIPVPGGRLLGSQMIALARLAAERGIDEFCLAGGAVLLAAAGANPSTFETELRQILLPEPASNTP